jgi:hypothetical protein
MVRHLLACWLCCAALLGTGYAQSTAGYINVQDYIVASANTTDHTEAIRAAFAEAGRTRKYAVLFPSGYYAISDTIDISAANEIVGQGYVRIEQRDPAKGIFHTAGKWRITIKGLNFIGGLDQIALGNPNTDQGFYIISECQFFTANGTAVRLLENTRSTHCVIEKCAFMDCVQNLVTVCDMTHLRDCWISTSPVQRDEPVAAIVNYGCLLVEHLLGVPRPQGANNRWIDNYGSVTCRSVRFGGEGGGFPAVNNFSKFGYPPTHVTLEDCYVYSAQRPAIHLEEIPNEVNVLHCNGLQDTWVMDVSPQLDLTTYFGKYGRPLLRIDSTGTKGTGIPEALWPYLQGAITRQDLPSPEGDGPPTVGRWQRGQFLVNRNGDTRHVLDANGKHVNYAKPQYAAIDEPYGWLCIESGTPGAWVAVKFVVMEEQ